MTTAVSFRELELADARTIDSLLAQETENNLRYFSAFNPPRTVAVQAGAAINDRYIGIWNGPELAGFYCLRGFDQGYKRPSFGIYVAGSYSRQGLARLAMIHAVNWCAANRVERLMLKVYPKNASAYKIYVEQGFVDLGPCPDTQQRIMEKVVL